MESSEARARGEEEVEPVGEWEWVAVVVGRRPDMGVEVGAEGREGRWSIVDGG